MQDHARQALLAGSLVAGVYEKVVDAEVLNEAMKAIDRVNRIRAKVSGTVSTTGVPCVETGIAKPVSPQRLRTRYTVMRSLTPPNSLACASACADGMAPGVHVSLGR